MAGDRFEVVEGSSVESTEAVGTIVAQSPYAGEMAEEGSEISVDVVGTRIADVPDVQGKTREEAERILKEAGFEVEVKTAKSSAEDENLVTGQSPRGDAGETARVGSAVAITVGEGLPNVEVPSITDRALSGTEQILEEAGLKLGSQMEVPNDRVPVAHIVEQHPAAGMKVEAGSAVDVVVSSGPQQPPAPKAEDATQTVGSNAPAAKAPASATPASAAPASAAPASAALHRQLLLRQPLPWQRLVWQPTMRMSSRTSLRASLMTVMTAALMTAAPMTAATEAQDDIEEKSSATLRPPAYGTGL